MKGASNWAASWGQQWCHRLILPTRKHLGASGLSAKKLDHPSLSSSTFSTIEKQQTWKAVSGEDSRVLMNRYAHIYSLPFSPSISREQLPNCLSISTTIIERQQYFLTKLPNLLLNIPFSSSASSHIRVLKILCWIFLYQDQKRKTFNYKPKNMWNAQMRSKQRMYKNV